MTWARSDSVTLALYLKSGLDVIGVCILTNYHSWSSGYGELRRWDQTMDVGEVLLLPIPFPRSELVFRVQLLLKQRVEANLGAALRFMWSSRYLGLEVRFLRRIILVCVWRRVIQIILWQSQFNLDVLDDRVWDITVRFDRRGAAVQWWPSGRRFSYFHSMRTHARYYNFIVIDWTSLVQALIFEPEVLARAWHRLRLMLVT